MADVNLTITIPDAHVATVKNAFDKSAGARMTIEADKEIAGTPFIARWDFTIDEQGGGETTKQYAIRYITELIKAVVKMVDYAEDQIRYQNEVALITKPEEDVDDGIVVGS